MRFAGIDFPAKVVVVDGLTAKAILGLDFIEAHECIVNIKKKLLELPRHDVSLLLERTDASCTVGHLSTANVRIQHTQHIPARSEIEVMAQVDDFISGGEWIIEQDPQRPLPVMVARAVITPQQGQFPVRILNLGDEGISLHQGTKLAVAERLDQDCVGIKAVSSAEYIPNTEDTLTTSGRPYRAITLWVSLIRINYITCLLLTEMCLLLISLTLNVPITSNTQ